MSGKRQQIQYSLALEPGGRGEPPVSGHQGAEPFVAKPAPESPALQANPIEPPWYVTRMPGGVGGVAPRGVPLSRLQVPPPEFDGGTPQCAPLPSRTG